MPFSTPITRYYIDTRPYVSTIPPRPEPSDLPLLLTLPLETQQSILAYRRPEDKLMSLSSALLKHLFIHRTARIPWSNVTVSRTPRPHARPFWSPTDLFDFGLEFNVSHQAGLTALIGCKTPSIASINPPIQVPSSVLDDQDERPRLGLDIACTDEPHRTPTAMNTDADFKRWVSIFGEMFSAREKGDMENAPLPSAAEAPGNAGILKPRLKLRRFYAYWALKEAYIKMVGEGLLASWLTELEFSKVVAPSVPLARPDEREEDKWTSKQDTLSNQNVDGFQVEFRGKEVEGLRMELVAYDEDFFFATSLRGVEDRVEDGKVGLWTLWEKIDIEGDVRDCAEETCQCLE